MTAEQHKAFTEACNAFGEALEKIFSAEAPTMERQAGYDNGKQEAVIESAKDWEILELKDSTNADYDLLLFEPGNYITRDKQLTYRLDHVLDFVKTKQWTIHSVRRLPDNSVWTIGDSVCHAAIDGKTGIYKFEINESVMLAYAGRWKSSIEFISRPENKPLFTTADGVEVYDKDTPIYKTSAMGLIEIFHGIPDEGEQWYSTREAAEKAYDEWLYIQPVLSIWDFDGCSETGEALTARLKELVKDKIAKR